MCSSVRCRGFFGPGEPCQDRGRRGNVRYCTFCRRQRASRLYLAVREQTLLVQQSSSRGGMPFALCAGGRALRQVSYYHCFFVAIRTSSFRTGHSSVPSALNAPCASAAGNTLIAFIACTYAYVRLISMRIRFCSVRF